MPRSLPFHSPLSFTVKDCEVTGCLLPPVATTTVGVIARDWSDWFSGFGFWMVNGKGLPAKSCQLLPLLMDSLLRYLQLISSFSVELRY